MPILCNSKDKTLKSWPKTDFYILDVEITSWEGSLENNWENPNEWREIIEIGSIEVSYLDDNFVIRSEFNCYIKPSINPQLSNYITELTGINQKQIDELGISFENGLLDLNNFYNKKVPIIFNGFDGEVFRDNIIINNLNEPSWLTRSFNLRPLLSSSLKKSQDILISSQLPKISGSEGLFSHHSALGDCKSILTALNSWKKKGFLSSI